MQRVNEAWSVLRDPVARRRYDESLRPPTTTARPRVTPPPPPRPRPAPAAQRPGPAATEPVPDTLFLWLVRIAPVLLVVGLLIVIFVVTAFARSDPSSPSTRPFAPGTCVSFSGTLLVESPCDGGQDARVVEPEAVSGPCPANTLRYTVASGELLCLRPTD